MCLFQTSLFAFSIFSFAFCSFLVIPSFSASSIFKSLLNFFTASVTRLFHLFLFVERISQANQKFWAGDRWNRFWKSEFEQLVIITYFF